MTDVITYPTTAMKQAAQAIRALLDAQWQQHLILYNNAPHSLTNLTGALSKGVSGGPALMDHVHAWHQQMAKNYESLYVLADALENGSINAITVDDLAEGPFANAVGYMEKNMRFYPLKNREGHATANWMAR